MKTSRKLSEKQGNLKENQRKLGDIFAATVFLASVYEDTLYY